MALIEPYLDNLLLDTLVPLMFVTEEDLEVFASNPDEFINREYD